MQKERVKENKESIDFQKPFFFLNTTCDASATGICVRFFFFPPAASTGAMSA